MQGKDVLEYALCDNIILPKYSTFYKIKNTYISLLENFAILDYMVDDIHMINYLGATIHHLYNKSDFIVKFKKIFLAFTNLYNDYTRDERLCKNFYSRFVLLLEEYKPLTVH